MFMSTLFSILCLSSGVVGLGCVLSYSSRKGDIVLDCFVGSGRTLAVSEVLGRHWIGIDNSEEAIAVSINRLKN